MLHNLWKSLPETGASQLSVICALGPTMLQLCHTTLQGIQLLLHLLSLLVAAVTEGSTFLLQRQHLCQQLAF